MSSLSRKYNRRQNRQNSNVNERGADRELLTASIRAAVPGRVAMGDKNPMLHVRLFCPWNGFTWYIASGWKDTKGMSRFPDDFICVGYVVGEEPAWGNFSIRELEGVRGPLGLRIERDLNFEPRRLRDEFPEGL